MDIAVDSKQSVLIRTNCEQYLCLRFVIPKEIVSSFLNYLISKSEDIWVHFAQLGEIRVNILGEHVEQIHNELLRHGYAPGGEYLDEDCSTPLYTCCPGNLDHKYGLTYQKWKFENGVNVELIINGEECPTSILFDRHQDPLIIHIEGFEVAVPMYTAKQILPSHVGALIPHI